MSHFKHIPASLLLLVLATLGVVAVVAGVFLLFGLATALIVGGVIAAAVGLLVDVD